MKTTLISLTVWIAWVILVYVCLSFIILEFNPIKWVESIRVIAVMMWIIGGCWIIGLCHMLIKRG